MSERNLNFEQGVDRKGTRCLKYDFAVQRGRSADILPLWVADMDFKTSSYIQDALLRQAEHGVYGYTETDETYFDAVRSWMERRHGWKIEPEWLLKTPGVVFALAMAVKAYTEPGDYVLIQEPVYYPFREVIESNDREVANNVLYQDENGSYKIDFEDFERQIVEKRIRLFLLCSPHNPVSRVWTAEELTKMGDICIKHGVTVVSDEIHEDFVFGDHQHTVFATIKKEFEQNSVTCTSPAKTFNLAGLQVSNIFIPNGTLRAAFRKQVDAAGYSQLNAMGLTACEAAYTHGETWYQAMMRYVESNIAFVRDYLKKELPQIKLIEPEGTYLLWLDFRALGMTEKERENLIVNQAKLWLDSGAIFGQVGEGFERINVACPRATIKEALDRLKAVITA